MTGVSGLGATAISYFTQLSQSTPVLGTGGLSGGEGAGGLSGGEGGSSVSLSPFAHLLNGLSQLQSQSPASFTQVVGQIAGQLESAAQQAQGGQADFLTSLAEKFHSVADGGSLSQLQGGHHHHHHRVAAAYGSGAAGAGQTPAQPTVGGTAPASGASGTNLQQLFQTLLGEVNKALAG
jgi:hypothetical protein